MKHILHKVFLPLMVLFCVGPSGLRAILVAFGSSQPGRDPYFTQFDTLLRAWRTYFGFFAKYHARPQRSHIFNRRLSSARC